MAVQDNFTDKEREAQEALNRSSEAAKLLLADPAARARIEAALFEMNNNPPAPVITIAEFLASIGMSDLLDAHDDPDAGD